MNRDFTIAPIFSEGCVLQRDKEIPVWGSALDGTKITVTLSGFNLNSTAAATTQDGTWTVKLPPLSTATGYTLTVTAEGTGDSKISIKNIAIGEVWIAGGQSNMEFPLRTDRGFKGQYAEDPDFRFFDVAKISYAGQEQDEDFSNAGLWRSFNTANAPFFSAAAYYFGRKLRDELAVPVGIIGCNYGGTSASCWMPENSLQSDPELYEAYMVPYRAGLTKIDDRKFREAYLASRRFTNNQKHQKLLDDINIGKYSFFDLLLILKKHGISIKQFLLSSKMGSISPMRPAALFEFMLKRIVPYGVRGVIFYQGESDHTHAKLYARLFTKMIECWRSLWSWDMPFLFVQIAPFGKQFLSTGKYFPELRHQQDIVAKTAASAYMASIMDAGEEKSIHPPQKQVVGERLALLALGKLYGKAVLCDAPEAVSSERMTDGVQIVFAHAGSGLKIEGDHLNGLVLIDDKGKRIRHFTTEAKGNRVYITSQRPIAEVRYAWLPYVQANLYGGTGLCAKPFITTVK